MKYLALFFVLSAVVLGGIVSMSYGEEHTTCFGKEATMIGTPGNDIMIGTEFDDVILGLGGQDVIRGMEGNDTICGGSGFDKIFGGTGDDIILTSIGDSNGISGGEGNDDCHIDISDAPRECEQIIFIGEGEEEIVVTVTLDKESYQEGDTVIISGTIDNSVESIGVGFLVKANDSIARIGEITLQSNNTFSETFILEPPFFSKGSTGSVEVTHANKTAAANFTFTPTPPPPPNEVFVVENARLVDPVTGQQVTSVETGKTIQILVSVENDQSREQDYLLETNTVGFEPQTRSQTGLLESGQSLSLMYDFRAIQPGNYIINIETFDNPTDRNIIAPTLTLNLTVVGEPVVTIADLLARIMILEAKVAALEAAQ